MSKARSVADLVSGDGKIGSEELASGAVTGSKLSVGQLANRNMLQNGNFIVSQDYWSSTAIPVINDHYIVDRWNTPKASGSGVNGSWQRDYVSVPDEHDHSMKFTVGTGVSTNATDYYLFWQNIEGHNTHRLCWGRANARPATLSFWVKASVAGTYGTVIENNVQNRAYNGTYTINSANTWEYKTVSIPAITSGTWSRDSSLGARVGFSLQVGVDRDGTPNQWNTAQCLGAAGQTNITETSGATWAVAGVQFEVGDATPYEHIGYAETLQVCRRFYVKSVPSYQETKTLDGSWDTSQGLMTCSKHNNYYDFHGFFPVEMRANPTMTLFSQSGTGYLRIEIPGVTNTETQKTPDLIRATTVGFTARYTVNETSRTEWMSGSGNAFGRIGYIADARL